MSEGGREGGRERERWWGGGAGGEREREVDSGEGLHLLIISTPHLPQMHAKATTSLYNERM